MCVLQWVSCASEKGEEGETRREACDTKQAQESCLGAGTPLCRTLGADSRLGLAGPCTDVPLYAALHSRGDSYFIVEKRIKVHGSGSRK